LKMGLLPWCPSLAMRGRLEGDRGKPSGPVDLKALRFFGKIIPGLSSA
jgi:hypothetical protein